MDAGTIIAGYILTGALALNNGGYVDIGVGMAPAINRPEVQLNTPVFDGEIGFESKGWTVFIHHNSGIFQTEEGAGFNLIGIKRRFGK